MPTATAEYGGQPIIAATFAQVFQSRATGEYSARLPGHTDYRNDVAISPEQARAWQLAPRAGAAAAASAEVTRGLAAEPADHFRGKPVTSETFVEVYRHHQTGHYNAKLPGSRGYRDHVAITPEQLEAWLAAPVTFGGQPITATTFADVTQSRFSQELTARVPGGHEPSARVLLSRAQVEAWQAAGGIGVFPLTPGQRFTSATGYQQLTEGALPPGLDARDCPFTLEPYEDLKEPVVYFARGLPQIAEFASLKEWILRSQTFTGVLDPLFKSPLDLTRIFRAPPQVQS